MARTCRAGLHAGRLAVVDRQVLVVDAVDAKRAFLHHAIGIVIFARAIGTGPGAELAADAGFRIDENDAVLGALVGRAGRTDGDASRLFAVQARAREMNDARCGIVLAFHFVAMDAIEPGAERIGAIGIFIGQRRGIALRVPFLAGGRAGLTADASVEVDDEAELLAAGLLGVRSSPGSQSLEGRELRLAHARLRFGLLDLHAQIVPGRLAGDRIGVGVAVAAFTFRVEDRRSSD